MRNIIATSLLFLLGPVLGIAGPISEAFSGDVLGVSWGAKVDEIRTKFPNVEYKEEAGMKFASMPDGRTMFGIERKPDNRIAFTLDADGEFSELNLEFPLSYGSDFTEKMLKLKTIFGRAMGPFNAPMGLSYEWPEEDGLNMKARGQFGIFGIGGGLYITVKKSLQKNPLSKSALGLQ